MRTISTLAFALTSLAFMTIAVASHAQPLTVVPVNAPAVNCLFDTSCRITVSDTVANLPPVAGYTGVARLQSRTATAAASGVPGAGTTVYMYRVDLTGAADATDKMCVSALTIDFGPITPLPYSGPGKSNADVFVVTSGGLGSVGLQSASRSGSAITFQLSSASFAAPGAPFPPVCPGQTSYFFGLASAKPPIATTAQIHMGVYGWKPVAARRAAP
jgi:hypothetical protein